MASAIHGATSSSFIFCSKKSFLEVIWTDALWIFQSSSTMVSYDLLVPVSLTRQDILISGKDRGVLKPGKQLPYANERVSFTGSLDTTMGFKRPIFFNLESDNFIGFAIETIYNKWIRFCSLYLSYLNPMLLIVIEVLLFWYALWLFLFKDIISKVSTQDATDFHLFW